MLQISVIKKVASVILSCFINLGRYLSFLRFLNISKMLCGKEEGIGLQ